MPAYHVDQSIEINASADRVYEVVADYGTWTAWSPWLCAEPDARVDVTGEPRTEGSRYRWSGDIVGEGEIEHLRLRPSQSIHDVIRFVRPFKSQSNVSFQFEAVADDRSKVTWAMDGKLPFFLFWMKSSMVSMIGMDYERGLRMLKELIEAGGVASETDVRGVEQIGPLQVAGVRKQCAMHDIGDAMDGCFADAKERLDAAGVSTEGEVISVYHHVDLKAKTFDFTAGYTVPEVKDVVGISTWTLPQCQALAVGHRGRYEHLGNAWSAAYQHVRYKKLKLRNSGTFEIYRNDPCETEPAELLTDVYLPLR